MDDTDAIFDSALSLPIESRADLADRLLDSLGSGRDVPDAYSAEYAAEVERRSDEMDAGAVHGVTWEEIRDGIDQRLSDRQL